jgi:uncharacterized membrane protein
MKWGKLLLVALYMSYYLSTTTFYHTHTFSWGTVVHSHFYFPFGDQPVQHSHSQTQCVTIFLLCGLLLTVFAAFAFRRSIRIRRVYNRIFQYICLRHLLFSPLRAPPRAA